MRSWLPGVLLGLLLGLAGTPVAALADYAAARAAWEGLPTAAERLAAIEASASASAAWSVEDQGWRLIALGLAYEAVQRIDDAEAAYESAVERLRTLPEPTTALVEALLERSYISYIRSNDPRRYCPDREEALRLARQVGNPSALANALVKNAFCFQDRPEQMPAALRLLDEAVVAAQAEGVSADLRAMIFNATATVYQAAGLLDRSYDFLSRAYALWAEADQRQDMFNMQHTMVHIAMRLGREDLASQHVERLFELAESSPAYADFHFFAHFNQGLMHYLARRDAEAIAAFDRAQQLEHTTAERFFADQLYGMRAMALFRSGSRDRGLADARHYLDSETALSELPLVATSRAAVAQLEGELAQALELLWRALEQEAGSNQRAVARIFDSQSRLLDERIAEYENRVLQQELALKQSELARAEGERRVAELNTWLASAIGGGSLLGLILLWRSRRVLRQQAQTDALSGLANRRHFMAQAERRLASGRERDALTLLLLDLDHFKRINDRYGHQCGDAALAGVGGVLRDLTPARALVGRVGGEEFALLVALPVAQAAALAERLRRAIAAVRLPGDAAGQPLSVSIGLAAHEQGMLLAQLYRHADEALYAAKHGGRDQARVWSPSA